ncbi:hypothetical protein V6N13_077361 [Hibiscus sabdariffa]
MAEPEPEPEPELEQVTKTLKEVILAAVAEEQDRNKQLSAKKARLLTVAFLIFQATAWVSVGKQAHSSGQHQNIDSVRIFLGWVSAGVEFRGAGKLRSSENRPATEIYMYKSIMRFKIEGPDPYALLPLTFEFPLIRQDCIRWRICNMRRNL